MKILTIGAAVLACATSTFASPASQASSAQRFFEAGQYDQALEAIAEERESGSAGPDETFLAGHVFLRQNQNDQARQEFARLAESDDEIWRLVGESSSALIDNDIDRSLDRATQATTMSVERAAAAEPDAPADSPARLGSSYAWYQLGLVKARREDWTGAAEAFDRAARIDPAFAYAHYYAGLAYSRVTRADRTAEHFEQFLKLAPTAPERAAVMSIMRTLRGR